MTEPEPDRPLEPDQVRTGAPWGVMSSVLLAVVLVVFAVQNTQSTSLRFLVWEWQMPLVIVIAGVAVVTIALTAVGGWGLRRRRARRAREKAELRRLREERP